MLAIDDRAAGAIRDLMREHELPEGGGLRIEAKGDLAAEPKLTISTAGEPGEQDEVVEHDEAVLFLEPVAAAYLADKLLSVETDDVGRASFVVSQR